MLVEDVSRPAPPATERRVNRLLVAFDGTPSGWAALRRGIALAVRDRALLTIAGMVGEPPRAVALSPYTIPFTRESILRDLESEMLQQLAAARDEVPATVSVTTQLVHGRPARALAALIKAGSYDMVIQAERPRRRFLLG